MNIRTDWPEEGVTLTREEVHNLNEAMRELRDLREFVAEIITYGRSFSADEFEAGAKRILAFKRANEASGGSGGIN